MISHHPILVGTIPIELDLPESDLDIICEVYDFDKFKNLMISTYGKYDEFKCNIRTVEGNKRVVCNFIFKGWEFEVFGQSLPTDCQNGYRHMIIEHRILHSLGDKAKEFIIKLKRNGLKTEPAFGKMLQLQSDPYQFLLEMYDWEDDKLTHYLSSKANVD